LLLAQSGGTPADVAEFAFEPYKTSLSCGSASSSNGVERGFLDVVLP
jgi:hypothetical protein